MSITIPLGDPIIIFGSQRSQRERSSGSKDDGTRWKSRAIRRSIPIRRSSADVVKPLSS
ncbi:hypothetical protein DPMN_004183 [Dreissena polymorpha]|uniref:Uncharacterized protein n=1 Tax=Dreissena polymorpha TaxID=45954 RepID=A0A9D4RVG7_DREPO|nr:hypothetical protein DPMN_004183 [Dreissena polymorpha]